LGKTFLTLKQAERKRRKGNQNDPNKEILGPKNIKRVGGYTVPASKQWVKKHRQDPMGGGEQELINGRRSCWADTGHVITLELVPERKAQTLVKHLLEVAGGPHLFLDFQGEKEFERGGKQSVVGGGGAIRKK